MAIKIKVRKKRQIVTPIRFARAKFGGVDQDFPDVDDRGFPMGVRPPTWGATAIRGAMVSVAQGDTINIRVLRTDIDASAPLFVHSTNPQVAAIVGSAGPLGANGIFQMKGVLDTRNAPVAIEVRLGSVSGPVLGELEPHIFQMRQIRVRAHLMTINGTGGETARNKFTLDRDFARVNKIWRAAGIEFLYRPFETTEDTVAGLAKTGQVTTDLENDDGAEIDRVLAVNRDPDAVNLYLVQKANQFGGVTSAKPQPKPHGCVVTDSANSRTLAHELGHFLSLGHSDLALRINAQSGKGELFHFRDDIWTERQLMYFNENLPPGIFLEPLDLNDDPQPAYRFDVGYGRKVPGAMIPVKDLSAEILDGCVAASRRRVLDPF